MATPTVKIDLSGLDRFRGAIDRDLRRGGNGHVRVAMRQWGHRYRSFAQTRFDRLSRGGGGEWPRLSASTLKRRRGPRRGFRGNRRVSILRDTNTLFAALTPEFANKPGQLQQDIPMGVRVGFGGPASYPRGKATIADIASFHQTGAGHLPQRELIVDPDDRTKAQMGDDMQRAVNRTLRDSEIR